MVEGAEENAESVIIFMETLLWKKLVLPPAFELRIERAHPALVSRPAIDSAPKSIVIKLSFRE